MACTLCLRSQNDTKIVFKNFTFAHFMTNRIKEKNQFCSLLAKVVTKASEWLTQQPSQAALCLAINGPKVPFTFNPTKLK